MRYVGTTVIGGAVLILNDILKNGVTAINMECGALVVGIPNTKNFNEITSIEV